MPKSPSTILRFVKGAHAAQRRYYRECRGEIAMRNLKLLRTISWLCIVLYTGIFLGTWLFAPEWLASPSYAVAVPAAAVLLVYIRWALRQSVFDSRTAQWVVLLSYALIMAYIIALSVFAHPEVASAYFPLFLVLAPVMFILPVWQHICMTVLSLGAFVALVIAFKSPAIWEHELFEAVIAAVFSLVAISLMMQFRLQTDNLKTKYLRLSRTDALTGLLNKSSGMAAFEQHLREKWPDEPCSVLFLDIDHFKSLNDTLGHLEGDRVLTEVGRVIGEVCRRDDITCRFGGDEFMIVLRGSTPTDAALKAEELKRLIGAIDMPNGERLTCSIGISGERPGSNKADGFIARADRALYRAKNLGRNGICVDEE